MEILKVKKERIWEFNLSNLEDLRRLAESLSVKIDAIENTSILGEPVQLGKLIIPNSLAIHPMEGCDGDNMGRPARLTVRRYERFARGGAGLIWAEATAVVPEGRANPRQLWLHKENKQAFADMIKMMRAVAAESMGWEHKPVIVAQLTHSGRYSKPAGFAAPIIPQRDPYRDPLTPQQKPNPNAKSKIPENWPLVTDEYLDQLQNAYVEAARLAFEVGFDAVDIKSCHGYLINELLACHNRPGKYGGSFENRTRFLLDVVDKIHNELGQDKTVVTRLGIYDAIPYPYGWAVDKDDYTIPDLTEPKKLIALLRQRGVKLIDITIANPYYNPHFGRPFNDPIVGGYDEPEHPLVGVARLINLTSQIQKEFLDVAIVGTGYSWLRTLMANVGAANKAGGLITIVGGGRMGFAYPDFPKDIIKKGKMDPDKVCVACSGCTQIMRDSGVTTGCVVRDNKVYGPIFMRGRLRDRDNLLRLAGTCRQCQEPTCQLACPAGIHIPKFIFQFLEGDDRGAYETIRQANILPEVCAWLCPVEQQCVGKCLQGFIGDGPLPIPDIQRYLAERANKEGWSKLRIPPTPTGKKVVVIGAGPAGIACAAKLLEAGHTVTIIDKADEFGGMVEAVIPPDRQSTSLENEIAATFKDVPKDRMILRFETELTPSYSLDAVLAESFDAAFIGMGLPKAVSSEIEPVNCEGLWNALDFLAAGRHNELDIKGKRVAVIGGGNTAMDCAVTAKWQGAKDAYVIYRRSFAEMPAWSGERDRAMDEGVHFLILTQPVGFSTEDGKLVGIKVCPTRLGDPDFSGRRRPEPVKSSTYELDMDIVVEAIGQKSPQRLAKILPGVELAKGLIKTRENSFQTSREKVFAGGDLIRGAATVVRAVADGMAAAKEIDKFLRQ